MINQTPNDFMVGRQPYYAKHKKSNKEAKKQNSQINSGVSNPQKQSITQKTQVEKMAPKQVIADVEMEQTTMPFDEDGMTYDDTPKTTSNKYKNALMGSLMTMAAIAMPAAVLLEDDSQAYYHSSQPKQENYEDVICNVDALAKGGKDDYVVEPEEIMQMLNFDGVEKLPKTERKAIYSIASVYARPINVNDPDARKKIIEEAQYIQKFVDKAVDQAADPENLNYSQKVKDYEQKYVSGNELVDNLDYSEISKYQKDVSVLRALLRGGISRIRRDDPNISEKFANECEKAQRTIDNIAARYKMNSHIVGNDNFDNSVTAKEIEGILDKTSLQDLSPEEQKSILSGALGSFKTINFMELKTDKDIKKTNQQVGKEVQKIQNAVDSAARKALLKKYNID